MSQNDDSMLDKFLHGKSSLNEIYQQGAKEQPPADLDAKILAQAQQAVQEEHSGTRNPGFIARRPRWLVPASLAATVMLGVNLAYNLKDLSPDDTYTENSAVVVDERFEEKRQQAAKRQERKSDDPGRNAQPSAQSMQDIQAQPPVELNYSKPDSVPEKLSAKETLINASPDVKPVPAKPSVSAQTSETNKRLEEKQRAQITGSRIQRDTAEAEPNIVVEPEIAKDEPAYAPAPPTIAMHDEEAAPGTLVSREHTTESVPTPSHEAPVTAAEPTRARSANGGFALSGDEKKNAQDADESEQLAELKEGSMASTAIASPPSPVSRSEDQNAQYGDAFYAKSQSYLCDLAAFGISDDEIANKMPESLDSPSRRSESVWKILIADIAKRGEYRQACLELAAFGKRYPNAKVPNDFPVRLNH